MNWEQMAFNSLERSFLEEPEPRDNDDEMFGERADLEYDEMIYERMCLNE